jgi:hypothetical protein
MQAADALAGYGIEQLHAADILCLNAPDGAGYRYRPALQLLANGLECLLISRLLRAGVSLADLSHRQAAQRSLEPLLEQSALRGAGVEPADIGALAWLDTLLGDALIRMPDFDERMFSADQAVAARELGARLADELAATSARYEAAIRRASELERKKRER